MRGRDVIFAIVIIVLWYFSAFYIAAPHDVHNMLFGGFGLTHDQHHILGVGLFIISLMVILVWIAGTSDESDQKVSKPVVVSTPATPAPPS
jgi:hypothetical protein